MSRSAPISDFAIDDVNEEKFWAHSLTARQVLQVLDSPFLVVPNRRHRTAPKLVLERDSSGRCIAIPVVPTPIPQVWRPVTAWFCKESEVVRLAQSGR